MICMGEDNVSTSERMLLQAIAVVRERRSQYGPPATSHFVKTIGMLNVLLAHKLRVPLEVSDWPQIMMVDKLARYQGPGRSPDCPVDLAGYASTLAEAEEVHG